MNPAQLVRQGILLGSQRTCEKNLRVLEMLLQALIAVAMDDFQVGKLSRQPLNKPWWNIPEIEMVMDDKQNFHGCGI